MIRTLGRLLTFRLTREEFESFDHRHLLLGLAFTWLAGVGRYWDHPHATVLQYFGVGSLVYILGLSILLWLVITPLDPERWSFRHLLTFISLTSPPALLYAIPVERFFDLETAQSVNVWFLAVVAVWRVALLLFYLRRHAGLPMAALVVASLLPIALIIISLAMLNLQHVVVDIMGGLGGPGSAHDTAYLVTMGISFFSFLALPVLIAGYVICIVVRRRMPRNL